MAENETWFERRHRLAAEQASGQRTAYHSTLPPDEPDVRGLQLRIGRFETALREIDALASDHWIGASERLRWIRRKAEEALREK